MATWIWIVLGGLLTLFVLGLCFPKTRKAFLGALGDIIEGVFDR